MNFSLKLSDVFSSRWIIASAVFALIYGLVSAAFKSDPAFMQDYAAPMAVLKCTLCMFLIIAIATQPETLSVKKSLMTAIFFCLLGDAFLAFNGTFYAGMACFLIGHLGFWRVFYQLGQRSFGALSRKEWLIIGFFVLYATGMIVGLKSYFGPMLVVFATYAAVLCNMSVQALRLHPSLDVWGRRLVFCGSLLFIASDSWLVINMFIIKAPNSMFVWTTYALAQIFIVSGALLISKRKLATS